MKLSHTIGIIFLIILGFYFFSNINKENSKNIEDKKTSDQIIGEVGEFNTYENKESGISFTYRTSPDGYTLITPENIGNNSDDFIAGIVLMRTTDFDDIQSGGDRGGPPTINLTIYESLDESLEEWLSVRNISIADQSTNSKIIIDGKEGVLYSWEGMFSGETAIIQNNGYVFIFEGMSHSGMEDSRRSDFRRLLGRVKLN